jgi:hypothetical protein
VAAFHFSRRKEFIMPIEDFDAHFCLVARPPEGREKIDLYDPGLVKFALNGSFC